MLEIHPTALVDEDAVIEEGVVVGPFCIIGPRVRLGAGTKLCAFVELREQTLVGERCYLDSGVKSSGHNRIEDEVTIRYDAIIAKGCRIGAKTFIAPQVMTINRDHLGEEIGGAFIGSECHIGTAAVLHPGITIAPGTVIGAKALVTRSITEPGTYIGIPARQFGGGGGI